MNRKKQIRWFIGLNLLGVLLGLYVAWTLRSVPDFRMLETHYPQVIYDRSSGKSTIKLKTYATSDWMRVQDVSKIAVAAIRISEDWSFFQHKGFDFRELKKSFQKNIKEKRYARGASTITQQVVKNIFLTKEKTLRRKIKEIIYSILLERKISKRKILECYLNIAEWGEGIYGIGKASEFYFGKPPSKLNAKEGAFLAMLLPSPKKYSISFQERQLTKYAKRTINSILEKLHGAGYLTDNELQREKDYSLFHPLEPEMPIEEESGESWEEMYF